MITVDLCRGKSRFSGQFKAPPLSSRQVRRIAFRTSSVIVMFASSRQIGSCGCIPPKTPDLFHGIYSRPQKKQNFFIFFIKFSLEIILLDNYIIF